MPAGGGAREQAEQKKRAAEAAARSAERYDRGADGEELLARTLAPLAAEGWYSLPDRVMPTGGNIDHMLVGPGGVVVMDAKHWNGDVAVRDGRLRLGRYPKDEVVSGVVAQAAAVRAVVGQGIPVVAALVFTNQPAAGLERVDGVGIAGIDEIVGSIEELPPTLDVVEVERLFRQISEALPPVGSAPPSGFGLVEVDAADNVRELFLRAHRFVYLETRGKHRIEARSDTGEDLGWKDLVTGEVHLARDHPFAEAVLRGANKGQAVALSPTAIPKIPVDIRGGRLLGAVTRTYMAVLVGQVSGFGRSRKLYGTLASAAEPVFRLGYVDLTNGLVHPDLEGPLSGTRGPAAHYLGLLRDRMPGR